MTDKTITREQCAAARAMLGWSMTTLAEKAKCSESTVRNFEAARHINNRVYVPADETMAAIVQVFERAGVEFTPENGHGPGVRLGLLAHYRKQRDDYKQQMIALRGGLKVRTGNKDETAQAIERTKKEIERLDDWIGKLERGEKVKVR
jgi:transcriptional regulator with XRE-family HTH domain